MAFTNEDVQEIKEIVLETIAEESDPIEDVQQVSELSEGDEVPIVRSNQGVNSYGRAPVNLFGGGGGEPDAYVKDASVSQDGNTLTLTKKDNSTVEFTPDGGYNPPAGGIPKTDLASDVQASLGKADTALQSHQDISGKADKSDTYTKQEVNNLISQAPETPVIIVTKEKDIFPKDASQWEQGTIGSDGSDTPNPSRYRTNVYIDIRGVDYIRFGVTDATKFDAIELNYYSGNSSSTWIGATGWQTSEVTVTPIEGSAYMRILLRVTGSVTATDAAAGGYSIVPISTEEALNNIPVDDRANKIFRVPGVSAYSEWAWDGTKWVELSEREYGIDDEPDAGSDNLVKSGFISKPLGIFADTGSKPYDEFLQYSMYMENIAVVNESIPITEASNISYTPVRLMNRTPVIFTESKTIRCDSGYKFKAVEIDPETNIVSNWPSTWSTSQVLQPSIPYLIVFAHDYTDEPIERNEHFHVYIDTFRQDIDNRFSGCSEKTSIITNRSTLVLGAKTDSPVDYMFRYISDAGNYMFDGDVGSSIFSSSLWLQTSERLSLPNILLHFDNDTVIQSDSNGYVFKLCECDANGILLKWESQWYTTYCARAGRYYCFTMKTSSSGLIYPDDFKHINGMCMYEDMTSQMNYIEGQNPFLPYYSKFINSGIDTDSVHPNTLNFVYVNGTIRRSCFFKMSRRILLSMRNSDYVFRFYWYDENNVYHENAWGTLWETPVNLIVGMSIKRLDGTSYADGERPELYLEAWEPDEMPKEYFAEEIEDTVSKVNAAFTEPGLCFLLSTDHHTKSVQGSAKFDTISDMVTNMKAVSKRIHVDANIVLGDITDYKVGSESAFANLGVKDMSYPYLNSLFYEWMDDAMTKLQSINPVFYYVLGNHDDNRYINRDKIQASVSAYDYTPQQVFAYYNARCDHNVVYNQSNNGLDYYADYDKFKIRIFFLDANYYNKDSQTSSYTYTKAWWYGFADETVSWMREQLALVPNDWSVIVCSHLSPIVEHNEDNAPFNNLRNMQGVIQDFINGGGNYIATLYGHTHCDWSATSPWLEVGFAAQKCQHYNVNIPNMPGAVSPVRTLGTYTEDCWNVVLILPESRKIKVIRFGAGDDMEFSY